MKLLKKIKHILRLFLVSNRQNNVLRLGFKLYLKIHRALFKILPIKISFFLIVVAHVLDKRIATFLSANLLLIKKIKLPNISEHRFSSFLTAKFHVHTVGALITLGAFDEAQEKIAKGGVIFNHVNNLNQVIPEYFDLGMIEVATQILNLTPIYNESSQVISHYKGLLLLLEEQESLAAEYLYYFANKTSTAWCAHQNIAANYPAHYECLPTDLGAGKLGLLFDAANYLGQRVVHVGRGELSTRLFSKALSVQKRLLNNPPVISEPLSKWLLEHDISLNELKILPWEWVTQVGHMGMMEILFRMRTAGWWSGKTVILAPRGRIANQVLLSLFETEALILIEGENVSATIAAELFSLQRYYGINFNAWMFKDNEAVLWQQAGARLLREWDNNNLPLRTVFDEKYKNSDYLKNYINNIKRSWGMGENDWYVCLHIRDSSYYKEFEGFGQTHRNGSYATYMDAIRYITDQGGWVIKLGDAKSTKLTSMPRVIDYARSKVKSEVMDLHLIRDAHFFIGTTSGLTNIAISFGVPCALVNCITTDSQLWNNLVKFIPKSIVLDKSQKLSQLQLTSTPWRWRMFDADVLRRHDAIVADNLADEILEIVKEVKHLADGNEKKYRNDFPQAHQLIARWMECLSIPEYYGSAQPSLYYLKKYQSTFLAKLAEVNEEADLLPSIAISPNAPLGEAFVS